MWTVRFAFVNIQKVKRKIILVVNSGETKFQQLSTVNFVDISYHSFHYQVSGRNVMLDLCLTVLMGEPGRLCVGDREGSARLVRFSRHHICCTDVGEDWSG